MRRVGLWVAGLSGSILIHVSAAVLLAPAWSPRETAQQDRPRSTLALDTVEPRRDTAAAQAPDAEAAEEQRPGSAALPEGAVPQARAAPVVPDSEAAAPLAAPRDAAPPLAPAAEPLPAARPRAEAIAATTGAASTLAARLPDTTEAVREAPLSSAPAPAAALAATALALAPPEAPSLPPGPAAGDPLPAAVPDSPAAAAPPLPADRATASTAWLFSDRIVTNPQALATIQAFMMPEAIGNADEVKDGLAAVLGGVHCARLSATYIPETGSLELRGHLPDPALQAPLLAAMRARVGDGLPVTANLLHLPAPQCGALTGIADAGLPQSTDQFTNERLVGETSHARAYTYTEGQRLQFDLTAPDYDAYVYVDYFTAEAEVIHLIPNETIPLEEFAAKTTVGVGQDRPGQPGLRLTIGPPYGQEIAVAFAASRPLYDGLRPILEPAGPYLEFLKDRIAAARLEDPDFKGEWVYFFITTRPATQ